jgi:hypothetical protein
MEGHSLIMAFGSGKNDSEVDNEVEDGDEDADGGIGCIGRGASDAVDLSGIGVTGVSDILIIALASSTR